MFYYFGRKGRLAPYYPAPAFPVVIEPFAGSMAYTLHHRPAGAIGIDVDRRLADAWNNIEWLTAAEILGIEEPFIGDRVDDYWMMLAAGSHGTTKANSYLWTNRMGRDLVKQKRLAARHVGFVRSSVTYRCGDYREAPDVEATWFIDPPYQHVRRGYARENIDYTELAEWVRSRRGQVIVCEQAGADWMPFVPLREIRGTTNKRTTEMVWLSDSAIEAAA